MPTHILRSANFIRPEAVLREAGIREGMHVVHFGAGPGFYVIPAAQFVGTKGRVVAVDIRPQMVQEVNHRAHLENLQNVDAFRGDLTLQGGSHLPDVWADLVILANILHQSDPRLLFAEAARVVRPDAGRVLVVEWELVSIPFGPPAEHRVTPDHVLAAARGAHLILLRRWKPSPYHYSMLFALATPDHA